jgi:hypothetical protein
MAMGGGRELLRGEREVVRKKSWGGWKTGVEEDRRKGVEVDLAVFGDGGASATRVILRYSQRRTL